MKKLLNMELWNRKEHFLFFKQFDEPFFGITVVIDCTVAYKHAKEHNMSFFLYYLYRALKAANTIENFRYRILDEQVFVYDYTHASPTINRANKTFGFAYFDFNIDEQLFIKNALMEIARVQTSNDLMPATSGENVIHFSALPWLNFSALSHARSFSHRDSAPKISFGKLTDSSNVKQMSVSIHVHHALMDAYHVAQFVEVFQNLMNEGKVG